MSNEIFGISSSKLLPTHLRTDPVRNEAQRRISVRLRDGHAGTTAAGKEFFRSQAGDAGWITRTIYESDLPAVLAKVEPADNLVAQATRIYYIKLRALVASSLPQRREQVALLPDDLSVWPDWARRIEARCDLSVERSHQEIAFRGIRAFAEIKISEPLPPPQSPEQQHEERLASRRIDEMGELARVIASETAKAVTAAMAPLLAQIAKK